jgi:hypothetical protein
VLEAWYLEVDCNSDDDDNDVADFFKDEETGRKKRSSRKSLFPAAEHRSMFSREVSIAERESLVNQRERKLNRYVILVVTVFCLAAIVLIVIYFLDPFEWFKDKETTQPLSSPTASAPASTPMTIIPTLPPNISEENFTKNVTTTYLVASLQGMGSISVPELISSMDSLSQQILAKLMQVEIRRKEGDSHLAPRNKRELALVEVQLPTSIDSVNDKVGENSKSVWR